MSVALENKTGTHLTILLPTINHAVWAVAAGSSWTLETILLATVNLARQVARDSVLVRAESIREPMMAICPVCMGLGKGTTVGDILHQTQDHLWQRYHSRMNVS